MVSEYDIIRGKNNQTGQKPSKGPSVLRAKRAAKGDIMKQSRVKWLIVLITGLLMAANVALGFFLIEQTRVSLKTLIDNRMLDVVKTAAHLLDGDELAALKAEDKGTRVYQRVNDTLATFQANIDLRYIYGVRAVGDKEFIFTVDPEPIDPGHFGEPIVYTDALYQASLGTPAADKEPYTDRWGTFFSAYCPVFTSSGQVGGIVAADFSAEWFEEQMAQQTRAIVYSVAFSLLMCASLGMVVAKRTKELELARERVEHMRSARDLYKIHSETDQLTGLLNKKATERLAGEYLAERKPDTMLALFILDLDHFKEANDTYGHSFGDKVLAAFASMLRHEFRPSDVVGRFGGDEFIVVISGLPGREIVERKSLALLSRTRELAVEGRNVGLSVSIGVAIAPQNGNTYNELFQAADHALYTVKTQGRDGYSVGPEDVVHRQEDNP